MRQKVRSSTDLDSPSQKLYQRQDSYIERHYLYYDKTRGIQVCIGSVENSDVAALGNTHKGDSMSKVREKRSKSKSGFFLMKFER